MCGTTAFPLPLSRSTRLGIPLATRPTSGSKLQYPNLSLLRTSPPSFAVFLVVAPLHLRLRGGGRVISDLAEIGYDAEWQIVGADDVGAWHRRKRIWIVAYPKRDDGAIGIRTNTRKIEKRNYDTKKRPQNSNQFSGSSKMSEPISEDVPDTGHTESQGRGETSKRQQSQRRRDARSKPSSLYQDVPDTTSKRRCSGATTRKNAKDVGELRRSERFGYWSFEPDVGRVANGIPKRVDRLKGIGNAVVPHIPYIIGKRLKELCQENQAEKH